MEMEHNNVRKWTFAKRRAQGSLGRCCMTDSMCEITCASWNELEDAVVSISCINSLFFVIQSRGNNKTHAPTHTERQTESIVALQIEPRVFGFLLLLFTGFLFIYLFHIVHVREAFTYKFGQCYYVLRLNVSIGLLCL